MQASLGSVRLACVKHAASVHPEPGSNSRLKCSKLSRSFLWLVSLFVTVQNPAASSGYGSPHSNVCFANRRSAMQKFNPLYALSSKCFGLFWMVFPNLLGFVLLRTSSEISLWLFLSFLRFRLRNFRGCITVFLSMCFVGPQVGDLIRIPPDKF